MDLNNVYDFLKTVVEINRAYYVDKDKLIRHTAETDDGKAEPVCVETPNGKRVPIMLFHANMPVCDAAVLNPFSETLGESGERKWLTAYLYTLPGTLIQMTLMQIVEMAQSKETENFTPEQNEILSHFFSSIDDKTAKELVQLRAIHYASILYNRRKRTAQLQVLDIDRNEFKIRKKTWEMIQGYIELMLQMSLDDNGDTVKQYTYTSNIIGCQEFDSMMHIVVRVCHSMRLYIKEILGFNIPVEQLEADLDAMEQYQKLCGWYAANITRLPEPASKQATTPWPTKTSNIPVPPVQQSVVAEPQPVTKIGAIPLPPGMNPAMAMQTQRPMFGGMRPQPVFRNSGLIPTGGAVTSGGFGGGFGKGNGGVIPTR